MITLFCDLDNTLIYSHRRSLKVPKRVAEMLDGTEQSYITEKTFRFLSTNRMISIIPVTTRTERQFERLNTFLKNFYCEYALMLNGAILYNKGVIDVEWLHTSKEFIKGSYAAMAFAADLLRKHGAIIKYQDDFLVYACFNDTQNLVNKIKMEIDNSVISVFCDKKKIYCTPLANNKGNATKRLIEKIHPEVTFGVGDSKNDISMLEIVDYPIAPEYLESSISNKNRIVVPQSIILSDAACDAIEKTIGSSLRK